MTITETLTCDGCGHRWTVGGSETPRVVSLVAHASYSREPFPWTHGTNESLRAQAHWCFDCTAAVMEFLRVRRHMAAYDANTEPAP